MWGGGRRGGEWWWWHVHTFNFRTLGLNPGKLVVSCVFYAAKILMDVYYVNVSATAKVASGWLAVMISFAPLRLVQFGSVIF